jgi:pimeloyl-ACP methyl ester carboxylesterase
VQNEPFVIDVADEVLDDLRDRIRRTRWPDPAPGEPWRQGTDLEYLRDLLGYWADGFDWRAQERWLNGFDHRLADVDGVRLHFVHHRCPGGGLPLVLTHGWPSTFLEPLAMIGLLGDRFDLVIPSLPGYGFSQRPARTGVNREVVADLWHGLMSGLGYQRYGAHGGDFGAGVTTLLGLKYPESVAGIHVSTPEMTPWTGPGGAPLTAAEQAYVEHLERWDATERGYSAIQSTRPQTLGYGLTDSPAGLAAWVLEKWRLWSDSGGDLEATFGRDQLLTMLTVWWVSGSITSSMRDYYDNRWYPYEIGPDDLVRVPTAMAVFANEFVPEGEPPRAWYERLYPIARWSVFDRGGHFAAAEVPDLLAADIAAFFTALPGVR